MSEKTIDRLVALVILIVPLAVYLLTMAPTVVLWDCGELIATAYILGIPHSPGMPLFTLLGRVFTMLPLPLRIAQRSNLFSLLLGSLAVLFAYLIAVATLRFMYPSLKGRLGRFMLHAGPVAGALYFTFSHTQWLESTETEVYAFNVFVMGLCTWLAIQWYRNPTGRVERNVAEGLGRETLVEEERLERGHSRGLVYLMIYLTALGIGYYLGTVLVYGGILLLFLLVREKSFANAEIIVYTFGFFVLLGDMTLYKSSAITLVGLAIFAVLVAWSTVRKGRFALVATGLLALGISVHLYMYIRAFHHPAINMVNPQTWGAMHYHLRREQYPPSNVFERKAPLGWQFGYFWGYFKEQFRMFGDFKVGPFNLGEAATAIPVALGLWGIAANFKGERKLWALNFTNLMLNSVGLTIYLNFSANEVRNRDYFYCDAFYLFAVFIGIGITAFLVGAAEYVERGKRKPAAYVVPLGALLVFLSILPGRTNWFTHDRSHNVIVREYAHNMLCGLEPDAIIFTGGDNDTYPLWYIQSVERYRTDVRVIVLTLLNTPWYIKELRDEEPKVPIALTDAEIERLHPIALSDGGVAYNDDIAVQHIIETTNWKRPIYFATSVSQDKWKPYQKYLETEGLAMRLVPYEGNYLVNTFMVERGFEKLFGFDGILTKDGRRDSSIYKDEDYSVTLNNYGAAAAELANALGVERDFEGAEHWMTVALAFAPRLRLAEVMLGTYYAFNGERERASAYFKKMTQLEPDEPEFWVRLAWVYSADDPGKALATVNEAIGRFPDKRQLYIDGFRYAAQVGNVDGAKGYIARWLERYPGDDQVRSAFRNVDSLLAADYGIAPGGAAHGTVKK